MKNLKQLATTAFSLLLLPSSSLIASERLEEALDMTPLIEKIELTEADVETPSGYICTGCSEEESIVLKALQERGIKDKYALAVIMGNIRQESKFDSKVCEGGIRTGYHGCRRGGFGLIQFTSTHRYLGLGKYASENQMDPNDVETQIQYVFTEREWKLAERGFLQEGKSIEFYMNHAYTWLGWGIHGSRTHYSNQYLRRLV